MTEAGTIADTLRRLFEKGVRYSSVIDLGCADGSFFLTYYCVGVFAGAVPINIDPNPLYEPSLRAIQSVLGGHYAIAAAADFVGETEMTDAAHPYWSSLLPQSDPYWQRINGLAQGKTKVPVVTVDALRNRLGLKPPFLIKLDVQGAELPALQGARETLKDTDVIISETDINDFPRVDRFMAELGFTLYDLTDLRRSADSSLGWFYPIYLSRRLETVRRRSFWDAPHNQQVIETQVKRRQSLLAHNAQLLDGLRKSGRF